jgi:predicted membrane chloride channel (bestrophin family)
MTNKGNRHSKISSCTFYKILQYLLNLKKLISICERFVDGDMSNRYILSIDRTVLKTKGSV